MSLCSMTRDQDQLCLAPHSPAPHGASGEIPPRRPAHCPPCPSKHQQLRHLRRVLVILSWFISTQVYKTQMSRVADGWTGKIDEVQKVNQGLQNSLSQLKDENELLRLKVRCIL